MRIIRDIKQMSIACSRLRVKSKSIGFVPTMGALHKGHLSLIRKARKENDVVAVSIFVNPAQFSPREDFAEYPRNFRKDGLLCKGEGVDILFYPEAPRMYPAGYKTYVDVEDLSKALCGRFRKGHFKGVTTVVAKLFNIVGPNVAYFGQKDAQQAIIIQRMAGDLNFPLKIRIMRTVREGDGLAMSSRNAYLSPSDRKSASVLFRALNLAKDLIIKGDKNPASIIESMKKLIKQTNAARMQYISIVNLEDLRPVAKIEGRVLIALAAWFGKTRLIDNMIVSVK